MKNILGVSPRSVIISAAIALLCSGVIVYAAQTNFLGVVFLADPTTPANQVKVNADGSINTTASGGGSAPVTTTGTLVTGQVAIVTTGTAVQFPANANLVNGILVSACGGYPASASAPAQHANSNGVTVGNSSVTNACTGSGTGDCIPAGASHGYGVNNTNLLWLNGVAGDCITFAGN